MPRSAPIVTALNAGELSPTLDGRVDIAKYSQGAKRLENFLPLIQGPAQRRAGTRFVAEVKDSDKRVWTRKFEFSATTAFVLEFGDEYVRFFTDHGQLLVSGVAAWVTATGYEVGDLVAESGTNYYCTTAHTSGVFATDLANGNWYALTGSIYEIPSPYALADLTNADGTCALSIVQSGDVLYIANAKGTYAARKLTRHADTEWIFTEYEPDQGPFLEQNSTAITMTASAQTGSVTITTSSGIFAATDVGRLIRIEAEDIDTKPWETAKNYTTGDLARYDGKTYEALNTKTSGTSPPIHTAGSAYDGQDGVQWEYKNAGYGVARITAFTSASEVTATVITDEPNGLAELPVEATTTATTRWALGAWSDTTGYPRVVAFFGPRLYWAGKPDVWRLWGSVPDDYENMAADFFGEVRTDSAIVRQIQAQDVNDVVWLVGADRLLIGTGGGEFVAGAITTSEPLGPANFQIVRQSVRRGRAVQPVAVGTSICYVQRAGRKLLGLDYSFDVDRYVSRDLAVLAERITRSGIVDMTFQGEPSSIIWCVLANGALRGFTYDPEQDVTGWHRHPIGGSFGAGGAVVESVVSIPAPDGNREELWLVVKRTINGATKRYIEYIERPWEGEDEDGTAGDAQEDAFYVDSGATYDGASTSTITGLDHLEGETVQILGDGAVQPERTVSSGSITLELAASVVQVGLGYTSRIVPMRLEAGAADGTAQGKIKRVHAATVRFLDTLGGKIGRYGSTLDDLSLRNPATPMGQAPEITSGDYQVDFGGDYDREGLIEIVQDQPLPMTVVAIMPRLETYDAR